MSLESTARRWYHSSWFKAVFFIFVGLFIGAFAVGISMKQLYQAAKGKIAA